METPTDFRTWRSVLAMSGAEARASYADFTAWYAKSNTHPLRKDSPAMPVLAVICGEYLCANGYEMRVKMPDPASRNWRISLLGGKGGGMESHHFEMDTDPDFVSRASAITGLVFRFLDEMKQGVHG